MSLIFEQIHTPGIGQLSYLIGDASTGAAAVIDPRPDVDIYLDLARAHGLGITHIFETHIHADFMSGARELRKRQPTAEIFASHEGGASYKFDHQPLTDGDRFALGDIVLTVLFTPGHTPEHVSFLMAEADREETPWAVFSGDSLFVNSVGRPDLLSEEQTQELAGQLYDTITRIFGRLDDGVTLFPGHGAGSSCGPDIGDLKSSTLGYEKAHNPYFHFPDQENFIRTVLETAPPVPRYYKPMKKVNAAGPPVFGGDPPVPALPVESFHRAVAEKTGSVLLDTRDMLAFGGGHIAGALHIGASANLSPWAGWLLDFDDEILLVLEEDRLLEEVVRLLWRVGFTKFAGYLAGGMESWDNAGYPLEEIRQMTVHELHQGKEKIQILDVRTPGEWKSGRIPGARHIFVPELRNQAGDLQKDLPIATYCGSGYRASIAASILKQEGFSDVRNVPGSWQAWKKSRYPIEEAA
jgi:hydroxyacylglutathione hydrolase